MTVHSAATIAALKAIETDILTVTRQALGQGAAYAAELARRSTKFNDGPAASLRGTIRRGERSEWSHFVTAGTRKVFWAGFVEDGTKSHEIRPKRVGTVSSRRRAGKEMPPVLRFRIAGRWVSARLVKHPGTKATHFMLDARDQAEAALVRFVEAGIRRVIGS